MAIAGREARASGRAAQVEHRGRQRQLPEGRRIVRVLAGHDPHPFAVGPQLFFGGQPAGLAPHRAGPGELPGGQAEADGAAPRVRLGEPAVELAGEPAEGRPGQLQILVEGDQQVAAVGPGQGRGRKGGWGHELSGGRGPRAARVSIYRRQKPRKSGRPAPNFFGAGEAVRKAGGEGRSAGGGWLPGAQKLGIYRPRTRRQRSRGSLVFRVFRARRVLSQEAPMKIEARSSRVAALDRCRAARRRLRQQRDREAQGRRLHKPRPSSSSASRWPSAACGAKRCSASARPRRSGPNDPRVLNNLAVAHEALGQFEARPPGLPGRPQGRSEQPRAAPQLLAVRRSSIAPSSPTSKPTAACRPPSLQVPPPGGGSP